MSERGTIPAEGAEPAAAAEWEAGGAHDSGAHDSGAHDSDAHDSDAHGHASALGPIDWRAYGAGAVGAALGLAVAAMLAVSTGYIVL
jgi:hypothetical protein